VTALLTLCLTAVPSVQAAGSTLYLPVVQGGATPTPDPSSPYYQGEFGYGINTAFNDVNTQAAGLGFGYVKWYVSWATYEPSKGHYFWNDAAEGRSLTNAVNKARAAGMRIIIRVDTPPAWAADGSGNRPPRNPADFGDFMGALAGYLHGRVAAYELWNEPNLSCEWGNSAPSPERYVDLLKAAYPKIKAADPHALVLTAGLATTGGDGGVTALDDLQFIQRMYAAGAKDYFDGLGSHPYGFASPPDTRNPGDVLHFQRAADQYAVMVSQGDGGKKVWATEFGWLLDPSAYGHPEYLSSPLWNGRQWQKVSPQTQADYLVRAFQYAHANWPWMAVMCVFNLDFDTVSWNNPADPMCWYSILNPDKSPRPAYSALQAMPKPTTR